MKRANYLPGKFLFEGFEKGFQEVFTGDSVTGGGTALEKEAKYVYVVTDTDVLSVSDGRGFVAAHAGGTYNLVAGHMQLLAVTLREVRQMRKIFFFHEFYFKNLRQR